MQISHLHACRSAVTTYGLWNQIRVDHGREFYLILYIQQYLRSSYGPSHITPYIQSPSTQVCLTF